MCRLNNIKHAPENKVSAKDQKTDRTTERCRIIPVYHTAYTYDIQYERSCIAHDKKPEINFHVGIGRTKSTHTRTDDTRDQLGIYRDHESYIEESFTEHYVGKYTCIDEACPGVVERNILITPYTDKNQGIQYKE